MQEKDIEKERFEKRPEECEHKNVVGVYDLGAQDGYICRDCGKRAQQRSDFYRS